MKICRKCSKSPLPFVMVLFIASVSAILTWLTLSYSELGTLVLIAGSVGVFLAVAVTLVHYVVNCLKRYCHHGSHAEHRQGAVH